MTFPDPQSAVILIAEDDHDDFLLAQEALKTAHILNPLQRVHDGEELMSYLRGEGEFSQREKYPFPNLLLLDLNMPKMDGREALALIKQDPELKALPTIVLTTSKAEEDILESYLSGGNSYIRKPVSFEGLVEIMRTVGDFWLEIVQLPELRGQD